MKFKAALFYQQTLVYYSIYHLGENFYKAKLDTELEVAPKVLELRRYNRSWASDCADLMLVSELGAAIDQRTLRA